MKNLFQKGIGSLFALFMLILLISTLITPTARAQSVTPYGNKNESYSQMWLLGNNYFQTATPANLGTQLDTVVNTATVNLTTSKHQFTGNYQGLDTVLTYPVTGTGAITLTASVLKCTGSPTVTVTPQMSPDGVNWTTIPGAVTATVVPTSLTIPVTTSFYYRDKQEKYMRLSYTGSGSSTVSIQAFFYFWANFTYYKTF